LWRFTARISGCNLAISTLDVFGHLFLDEESPAVPSRRPSPVATSPPSRTPDGAECVTGVSREG
jgi:hypothetical protein